MSKKMNINIEDDYSTSTYNFGQVDGTHEFMVSTYYDSKIGKHIVENIVWTNSEPKKKGTAERRITDLALKINAKQE
jgi:hypothetical protein